MEHNKNQDFDDLDKALDEFDNEQLNLTNEQKKPELDEDPQTAAKIKQEYEKFMQQMKNFGMGSPNEQEGMQNLTNMLSGLLKNLSSQAGMEGQQNDLGKGFEQMFKNLKEDNIQEAAGKLLSQFMDKSLLYEPLVQAKQHYQEYFAKNEGKIAKEDQTRYKSQYDVLQQIIDTLDNDSNNKQKLIQLFQKMQEFGSPPEGISAPGSFM